MKILHLAASNRWTGAAAPAFAEVEALRAAGVDAHYAYVGGYRLEQKIGRYDFAHRVIEKNQNPMTFRRSVEAIYRMIKRHGFDFVHAHLTYDHWLARFAAREHNVRLARTFHSRRTLRQDPFTKSLVRRTSVLCLINDTFRNAELVRDLSPVFTPPPLDQWQFRPDGPNVRESYGISADTPLFAVIGKMSPDRGFEEAVQTFAEIRKGLSAARLMIIGRGPHRSAIEELARTLDVSESVFFAGYHETDLAEHYRAANALLFTVTGSDEGHRAVIEAMGCGVPPASFPIEGLEALYGHLSPRLIAASPHPEALAERTMSILSDRSLVDEVIARASAFNYESAANRLIAAYSNAM